METNKTTPATTNPEAEPNNMPERYLEDSFNIYKLNTTIRINAVNPVIEGLLTALNENSYAFLTAWNPLGNIFFPDENISRNKQLRSDLVKYMILDGEWTGDDYKSPPYAGFLVLGINRDQAMQLTLKYNQGSFVYGEQGKPAKIVYRPLHRVYRMLIIQAHMNRCNGVTPERFLQVKSLFKNPIIAVPISFKGLSKAKSEGNPKI